MSSAQVTAPAGDPVTDSKLSLKWNPAVGSDCSGLYVNYFYCIDAPLDVASLPNATTQYFPAVSSLSRVTVTLNSTFVPEPTAPGAAADCQSWYIAQAVCIRPS